MMAKQFGGTMTVNIDPGQKLITVTWKNDDMWYLTRPMRDDEAPEKYSFREDSNFGVMEGKVILQESR